MKNTRKWSTIRKLLVSVFGLAALAFCSFLIWLRTLDWDPYSGQQIIDPDLLATNADFALPPSAHNVQGYFSGFNNFTMYGKFDMDADEFDSFENNANCFNTFQPIDPNSSYLRLSSFQWWHPSPESLICRGGGDGCGKTLIVDKTQTDTYTVYVHAGCG